MAPLYLSLSSMAPKPPSIEPLTPPKIEPRNAPAETDRRRIPRIAPPEAIAAGVSSRKRNRPVADESENDTEAAGKKDGKDKGILCLRSGRKIVKPRQEGNKDVDLGVSRDEDKANEVLRIRIEKEVISGNIAQFDIPDLPGNIELKELEESLTSSESGTVGKIKREFRQVEKVKVEGVEVTDKVELDEIQWGKDTYTGVKTRRYWNEKNGKEKVVGDELLLDYNVATYNAPLPDNIGQNELGKEPIISVNQDVKVRRVLSRKDKGKDKVVEDGFLSNIANPSDLNSRSRLGDGINEKAFSSTISLVGNDSLHVIKNESENMVNNSGPMLEVARNDVANARGRGFRERFRDIARKNASRFAHFSSQEPVENHVDEQPVAERTIVDDERELEDWPGPFSTAMKIIKDREANVPMAQLNSASNKSKTGSIKWVPKTNKSPHCSMHSIPKLQDLCMDILVKNVDAICSLENVPDVIRHKLSHMLCDSRKMNAQFFDLLLCGSPTEIRIRDCSWLTEEEFAKALQRCDTSLLTVVQLDQCGRCLPDYILSDTLARSPNALPLLSALSIKGACRFSDAGLSSLVASAPALRSINLSQCSLLTCDGISTLADSLGSILRELYMDDCENIDPMLILPALLKLEQLEVLSLAGIQTVSDVFISEIMAVRGRNFKELVLRDCTKLTDSSLKAIAETCTDLHALDLSNLYRLTDSALGYLANGCRRIGRLKLSRNTFSDEAIAAYIEASGESLKELALNNIRKVADDTAISLARRSRNLLTLDLSWCRNLTNEALGLIVDSCLSLEVLKLFGCTQITNVFVDGHSNPRLHIIGLKMTPILNHLKMSEPQQGPLHYSTVFS